MAEALLDTAKDAGRLCRRAVGSFLELLGPIATAFEEVCGVGVLTRYTGA